MTLNSCILEVTQRHYQLDMRLTLCSQICSGRVQFQNSCETSSGSIFALQANGERRSERYGARCFHTRRDVELVRYSRFCLVVALRKFYKSIFR